MRFYCIAVKETPRGPEIAISRSHPKFLSKLFKIEVPEITSDIVEIKAVSEFSNKHRAQMINYLKATKMKLGFLVNFGHFPKIEYERMILTNHK